MSLYDQLQKANSEEAMNMLKGALYNLELNKRNADKQALEDAKTDIGNTQGVLDGDLDPFIQVSLKQGV